MVREMTLSYVAPRRLQAQSPGGTEIADQVILAIEDDGYLL
jgi:hypothetical protein